MRSEEEIQDRIQERYKDRNRFGAETGIDAEAKDKLAMYEIQLLKWVLEADDE